MSAEPTRPQSNLSIAICAYNALKYTKLLIDSIRKHSKYEHEIVLYSDGSTDGTLEWFKDQPDIIWTHNRKNRGICTAMNQAARMAKREYLFFPNTDHVLAPGWDETLLKRLGPRRVVSTQCIEPGLVPVAAVFHTVNCGARWDEFDEGSFHEAARRLARDVATPGINYPFAISKELWNLVGGLDERFNPGPANDLDLFFRLFFVGAEMIRAEDCIIYHFSGKSSRMADESRTERPEWHAITDRNEARFAEKWGERYPYSIGGLPKPGEEAKKRWSLMAAPPSDAQVVSHMTVAIDARSVDSKMQGIGIYTLNLIKALARLGAKDSGAAVRLELLTPEPRVLLAELGESDLARIHRFDPDRDGEGGAALKAFQGVSPQLFHGPAFWVPKGLGVPSVVTIHDLIFLLHPEWYPEAFVGHMKQTVEHSVEQARGIIADSECTKRDLIRHFPSSSAKIARIYAALPDGFTPHADEDLRARLTERWGLGQGFILAVGVQQRRKNAARLVEAFSRLLKKTDLKERLVLVGGAESEDPDLVESIRRQDLLHRVVLTGRLGRRELAALYLSSRLFVYPSLYEGFGLPVLEAMACGTPVVCSDRSSLPEVAGEAAILCDPENVDSLAESMRRVLSDSALRDRLIEQGKKQVERFSWAQAATGTLAVYKKAIAPRPLSLESKPEPVAIPKPTSGVDPASRLRIAIDGRLFGQTRLGTGRYTTEIVKALLLAHSKDVDFILIGPKEFLPSWLPTGTSLMQHIPFGPETLLDPSWEQFSLPSHLLGCDAYFAPTGIVPVARPCKAIPVVHDLGFEDHPDHYDPALRSHLSRWIRNSCLAADRIVAVSRFTKERIQERYGVSPGRIRAVHHGRPSAPADGRAQAAVGGKYVLCVSSFEPNKNLGTLVDAFAILGSQWPGHLVLAGRSGRDLGRIQNLVRGHGLEPRVRLVLDRDDAEIESLYRGEGAALFAFPSLYEGFGLPLVEAMSAGLPIVANRVASCAEVTGEAGLLLEDFSAVALAEAMNRVLTDNALAERLGKASLARASEFTWERAASETWSAILECVQEEESR